MNDKVVVTAALSGAFTQKGTGRGMTPYLPITPDEVAEEAKRAYDAGASIVHIHARDPHTGQTFKGGQGEQNLACFQEMIEKIKAKCPVIIQISTGGGLGQSMEEKLATVLEPKPETASFTSGSISYGRFSKTENKFVLDSVVPVPFSEMMAFANAMRETKTKPELEIYNQAMLNNIKTIEFAFESPLHFQFVMGMPGQVTPPTPRNLIRLVDTAQEMFEAFTWSIGVAGIQQWPIIALGAILGAHCIRAGLEDNIYLKPGVLAKSNGECVEKAVRLAEEVGREIASVDETRKLLNLRQ